MASISLLNKKLSVLEKLQKNYPEAHCELVFKNPFELLIATILSAQCTDVMVNRVTPALFAKFPDAKSLAKAPLHEVEGLVKSTGFFRTKAANIVHCARIIEDNYRGFLPQDLEGLTQLPGVGRKTANVVLGNAFGIASGIVVDTHVARLSQRLGWVRGGDPLKIERSLARWVPRQNWIQVSHWLIAHGRRVCRARKPECLECFLSALCPSSGP